ncbi:hypothetical protein R3P38DRAFT_3203434 [Favolaschia claudopus]|uniref:Arrestin-like N-terminal domain-containing protein n=1 Tax=Favolaschia claudopus TaxID=2862362 RepID=A0AAW0ASA8_9AGAR
MAYVPPTNSLRNPFAPEPATVTQEPPSSNLESNYHQQNPVEEAKVKEYTFDLVNKAGKPWAVLSILGNEEYSKTIPAFDEGVPVAGEVRLDLESSDSIHAIILSVKGQLITGINPVTFIDVQTTLWSRSMGDPRKPSSDGSNSKWNEKLKGNYVWPFSVSLPPTITIGNEVYRLPESFSERHTRAQIEYEVSTRYQSVLTKNTTLRLNTVVHYIPFSRPTPSSGLRQLAYSQHTALLGPESDPEGWYNTSSFRTKGKLLSSTQTVEAICKLSLALPLCYTRGTSIPCAIVIECEDPQALELLTAPEAIVLRMRRSVRFHTGEKAAAHFGDIPTKLVWKEELDHSELASWWPAADRALETDSTETIAVNPFQRMLRGEIHLRPDLTTSSAIEYFRIEYSVVLFPFDAPGFESLDSDPLVIQPLSVAAQLYVNSLVLLLRTDSSQSVAFVDTSYYYWS